MSARLVSLLERLPSWARRGLMIALPLALLGVLVGGFALAPRGAGSHSRRAAEAGGLLPPSPTTGGAAPARRARPPADSGQSRVAEPPGRGQRARGRTRAAHPRSVRGPVTELPPAPAAHSAEAFMLAIARRFAIAYMPYQVGRLPRWARIAIARTCTPAFARYLFAQPARPTPLHAGHAKVIETYRVASVHPAGTRDTVAVSYVSEQDSADTGEFLVRLVKENGGWRVASLEA